MKRPVRIYVICVAAAALAAIWFARQGREPVSTGCPGCRGLTPAAPPPAAKPGVAADQNVAAHPPSLDENAGLFSRVASEFEGLRRRLSPAGAAWRPRPPRLGDVENAWQEAVRRLLADPAECIAAGDRAMARMDFQAAEACFARAMRLDADNLDAAQGRALALTAAGRHEEAADAYRGLLRRLPADRTTKYNLAVTLAKIGRLGESRELFEELVESHPDFMEAWNNLAALCTAEGKLSRARQAWSRAAELSPRSAYPCLKLGETLMDLEAPQEALLAFSEAAKRDPNDPVAHMNVAAAAIRVESFGRAMVAVERASSLAPGDPSIWASLGNIRAAVYAATREEKFRRLAVQAWEKSLAIDANQPGVRESLNEFSKEPGAR
jgi:tetratricopeptide (TPR) repeat protein